MLKQALHGLLATAVVLGLPRAGGEDHGDLGVMVDFAAVDSDGHQTTSLGLWRGWTIESGHAEVMEGVAPDGGDALRIAAQDPLGTVTYRVNVPTESEARVLFADLLAGGPGGRADLEGIVEFGGAVSGFVRIGEGGSAVYVFDAAAGSQGEWLSPGIDLAGSSLGGSWVRLTVRLDEEEGVWDLYLDGRLVAADLGVFSNGGSAGTGEISLRITGGVATDLFVDNVAVTSENPLFPDADRDGLADDWAGGVVERGSRGDDVDGDGLNNLLEQILGTSPLDQDSDGDGVDDGDELLDGTDPATPEYVIAPAESTVLARAWDASGSSNTDLRSGSLRAFIAADGFATKEAEREIRLPRLEILSRWGERYVSRIRGLLVPPVTGDYVFWVAGDDEAELLLGVDDTPFAARRIARVPSFTRFREWDRFLGQRSTTHRLVAGRAYYFELRHLETGNDDHVSVAWRIPGMERSVITARHVRPYESDDRDLDDDGLADEWEVENGLSPVDARGDQGPNGDPDGDRMVNSSEQLFGLHPLVADVDGRPGLVLREVWDQVNGAHLVDLERDRRFPHDPDSVEFLSALETSPSAGDHYGERLRGFLRPDVSGDFHFHVSGDDEVRFLLSDDHSRFGLQVLAETRGWTGLREFNAALEQSSGPVSLDAGTLYYFEILHKQGDGDDHLSVAWTRPGSDSPEIIGGEHLVAWLPDPADADDNNLPDDWEAAVQLGTLSEGPGPSARHDGGANGDPDRDGRSNQEERLLGSDPLRADVTREDIARAGVGLLCELWFAIPGAWIGDLAKHPRFPREPDHVRAMTSVDYAGLGDAYGARLRGYVVAPADGDYVFALTSDDASRLWLSSDQSPFNRRLIAEVTWWSNPREPRMQRTQISRPIALRRGERYYLEILHKEGDGADHLSLLWTRPDQNRRELVRGEFLEPFLGDGEDENDDGLPDAWQRGSGLASLESAFDRGSFGDPDGDQLDNLAEYAAETDPLNPDSEGVPGHLRWELWWNLGGFEVDRLTGDPRYPNAPTIWQFSSSLAPVDRIGDAYGGRLRGHVVAPESGTYVFTIAGDDTARLYLGSDEGKFSKQLIAEVPARTELGDWERYRHQTSVPISLQSGRHYYIEVLYKESTGDDHVTVGWIRPGSDALEIIDSLHLVSFSTDANDSDDDELHDGWEREHGLDSDDARDLHGYHGDPDGDGLSNRDEFLAGSDPWKRDTDGDGLDDFVELRLTRTDPASANSGIALLVSDSHDGAAARGFPPDWSVSEDGTLRSASRRGSFEFSVTLPATGRYLFELEASTSDEAPPHESYFDVAWDGFELGSFAPVDHDGRTVVRGLLPFSGSGVHTIRFTWENSRRDRWLHVHGLRMLQLGGADSDEDGLADWLEAGLADVNRATVLPETSLVSPVWIEGVAEYPGRVVASSSLGGVVSDLETILLPRGGWGVNVPLAEDGAPTAVGIGFEGGLLPVAAETRWESIDLLSPSLAWPVLRIGDALRLTVSEPGEGDDPAAARSVAETFVVRVDGIEVTEPVLMGDVIVHVFDQSGLHQIGLELRDGNGRVVAEATHQVQVVSAGFGAQIILDRGSSRQVTFPDLEHETPVDHDEGLRWIDLGAAAPSGRRALLESWTAGIHRTVMRVSEDEGAAVVATGSVRVVDVRSGDESYVGVAGRLADGTEVVEMDVVAPNLPAGVRLELSIFVAGVTFEDGSTTLVLTAEDFGDDGVATIRFLKSPEAATAICHYLRLVQEDPPDPDAGDPEADE